MLTHYNKCNSGNNGNAIPVNWLTVPCAEAPSSVIIFHPRKNIPPPKMTLPKARHQCGPERPTAPVSARANVNAAYSNSTVPIPVTQGLPKRAKYACAFWAMVMISETPNSNPLDATVAKDVNTNGKHLYFLKFYPIFKISDALISLLNIIALFKSFTRRNIGKKRKESSIS